MDQAHSEDKTWLTENGTVKVDRVALRALAFWLPHTKEHLVDGVPFASNFVFAMSFVCRVNQVNYSSPRG